MWLRLSQSDAVSLETALRSRHSYDPCGGEWQQLQGSLPGGGGGGSNSSDMGNSHGNPGIRWTEALVGVRFLWADSVVWFGSILIVSHSWPLESSSPVSQWFCELPDILFYKVLPAQSEWCPVLKTLWSFPFSYLPHLVSYHSPWSFMPFPALDFMLF